MTGFLYWFPGLEGDPPVELLQATGVDVAARDLLDRWQPSVTHQSWPCERGPFGDGPGTLLYVFPPDRSLPRAVGAPDLDTQQWHQCDGIGIGFDRELRPGPDSLRRPTHNGSPVLVAGESVRLEDGAEWVVPLVRSPIPVEAHTVHLPRRFVMGPEGEFLTRTVESWEWLWDVSGEMWEHIGNGDTIGFEEAGRLAALVLSANYRIGPREALALGVFSTDNFRTVFKVACDRGLVEEVERFVRDHGDAVGNGEAAASSSSPGVAADSPDTDRPEPPSTSSPSASANHHPTSHD